MQNTRGSRDQYQYRIRRRKLAIEYLGGECIQCGSRDELEFDHINPSSKVKEISGAIIAAWSWERLVRELDKCQLLCKPHHLEKTLTEGSLGGEPWNKINDPQHGTCVMYTCHGCRCPECKGWKRQSRVKGPNWQDGRKRLA